MSAPVDLGDFFEASFDGWVPVDADDPAVAPGHAKGSIPNDRGEPCAKAIGLIESGDRTERQQQGVLRDIFSSMGTRNRRRDAYCGPPVPASQLPEGFGVAPACGHGQCEIGHLVLHIYEESLRTGKVSDRPKMSRFESATLRGKCGY